MSLILLFNGGIPATQITASDSVAVSASDSVTTPIQISLGAATPPLFESNFDEFGENVVATEAGFTHHVVSGTPTSIASIGSTFALNGGKGMRIRTDDTWRHFLYKPVNSSYIRLETLWRRADSPSGSTQIFSVRSVAGLTSTTPVAGVRISSTPHNFQLYNGSTLVATSGTATTLNQIYKLVYTVSGGIQKLDIFTDVNANTAVDTPYETVSGVVAAGPYELFGFGSFSSTSTAFIYSHYDDMKIETAAPGTGLISETRSLAVSEVRKITHPDHTNLLHNPSFEDGLGEWGILPEETFGGAATLEVIEGDAYDGNKKLRVTCTTTGPFSIVSEMIPTLQSEPYIGIGFAARQTAGTPIQISARRVRYRNDRTFLGVTGIVGALGNMSSTWTRWWGSSTFTQTSTDYHAVSLYFNNATAGDVYEIDAVQLEKQSGSFVSEVAFNPTTTPRVSDTSHLRVTEKASRGIVGQQNRLVNPSFEEYNDWVAEPTSAAFTAEIVTVPDAPDGSKVLQITMNVTGRLSISSPPIPINTNIYTWIGAAVSHRLVSGTHTANGSVNIREATDTGTSVGGGGGGTVPVSTWTRKTFSVQRHVSGHSARVNFLGDFTAGSVIQLDAVQLNELNSSTVPAFDPVIVPEVPSTPIAGSDSGAISISETSSINVIYRELSASDTSGINIVDTGSIVEKGNQFGRADGSGTVVGTWTGSHLDVDEIIPDDNDYIESSTNPATEDFYSITLSAMDFPEDGPHTVRFRYSKNASGGRDIALAVQLRQGDGTIISDRNLGILPDDNLWRQEEYTLTSQEIALITDYQDLRFRFNPTASGGGQGRSARISWIEIEIPPVAPPVESSTSDTGSIAVSETSQITEVITKSASDTLSFGVVETYQGHDLVIQGGLKQVIMASDAGTMTSQYNSAPFNITTGDKIIVIVQAFETDATDTFASASALGVTWNGTNILKYGFKGHIHIMEGTATQTRSTTLSVDRSPITNPWTVTALLFGEGANIGALPTATLTGGSQPRVSITPTFAERQILFTAMSDELDGTGHPTQFDYLAVEGELPNEIYFRDVAGGFGNTYVALYGNTSGTGPYTVGIDYPGIWSWWAAAVEIESVYSAVEWEVPSEPIAGSETTAISVSEVSSIVINNFPTASDTSALAVADASTSFRTLTASDSQGLRITDISNIGSTLPGTETTAIGVAETSNITVTLTRTDTSSVAIAETRTQSSTFTRTDTGSIAIADASTTAKSSSAFDITGLAASETTTGEVTAVASDTSAIAVTEISTAGTSLPGVETTAIGVTETVVINVTQAASDTSALSLAEQTTSAITVSRTDTSNISVADTTNTALTVDTTDAVSISVAETTAAFKDLVKTGTDTASLAIADTSSSYRTVPVSDAASISITDISNIGSTLPGTEVNAIGVAESAVINVVVASADASGVAVTETRIQNVTVARTDAASLTVVDASTSNLTIARSDAGAVSVTDTSATLKSLSANDTGSIAVNETTGFASDLPGIETISLAITEESSIYVTSEASDASAISITETQSTAKSSAASETRSLAISETRDIVVTSTRTDTGSISVSDTSSNLIFATKEATDSGSIATTEAYEFADVQITGTDSPEISVVETTQFTRDISSDDTTAVAVVETAQPFSNFPGQDIGSISVVETSSIVVSGNFTKSASDQSSIAVLETRATTVGKTASEVRSIAVSDVSSPPVAGGGLSKSAADTQGLRLTEAVSRNFFLDRTDNLTLAIIETTVGDIIAVASDTSGVAVTDTTSSFVTKSASDSSGLRVTDASIKFVDFPGHDVGGLSISETSDIEFGGVIEKTASDSLSVSIGETALNGVTLVSSDTGSVAIIDDANFGLIPAVANDTIPLKVTESVLTHATINRVDALALIVVESRTFEQVARTASDTSGIAVTETANVQAQWPGADSGIISIEETSRIDVTGTLPYEAEDTDKLSIEESAVVEKTIRVVDTDTLQVGLVETIEFADIVFATSDTLTIRVEERGFKGADYYANDEIVISLEETSFVNTAQTWFDIFVRDTGSIRVTDMAAVWHAGRIVPISFATNTRRDIILNVAGKRKGGFNTSTERKESF